MASNLTVMASTYRTKSNLRFFRSFHVLSNLSISSRAETASDSYLQNGQGDCKDPGWRGIVAEGSAAVQNKKWCFPLNHLLHSVEVKIPVIKTYHWARLPHAQEVQEAHKILDRGHEQIRRAYSHPAPTAPAPIRATDSQNLLAPRRGALVQPQAVRNTCFAQILAFTSDHSHDSRPGVYPILPCALSISILPFWSS